MNLQFVGRWLLRLRYDSGGVALNRWLRAHAPGAWTFLRDLAMMGHRPTLWRHARRWSWRLTAAPQVARLHAQSSRRQWIRAFAAILARPW